MGLIGASSGVIGDMANACEARSEKHNRAPESLTISRILVVIPFQAQMCFAYRYERGREVREK